MRVSALLVREWTALRRSTGVWLAAALFAGVLALGTLLPSLVFPGAPARLGAAFLLGPATDLLLPALGIVYGHAAIGGRRTSGELLVLLGVPYRRAELFLGVWLARSLFVGFIGMLGAGLGVITVWLVYGSITPLRLMGFVLMTGLAGMVYTGLAVSVSVLLPWRRAALGALLAGFVVAYRLWGLGIEVLRDVATPAFPGTALDILEGANPLTAYGRLADTLLPAAPRVDLAVDGAEMAAAAGPVVGATEPSLGTLGSPLIVLMGWGILSAILGVRRIRRMDFA